VLGVVFAVVVLAGGLDEPGQRPLPDPFRTVVAVASLALCGGLGGLNIVAAIGLGRRAYWGWLMALVVGAIYVPSGCLPFGAVIVYALLREDARLAFGVTRPAP
jgi:hypothetical protein